MIFLIFLQPYSIFKLPEIQQFQKLQQNFQELHIIQNGKFVPLKVDKKNEKQVFETKEIIDFLCDRYNCNMIREEYKTELVDLYETHFKEKNNANIQEFLKYNF